jgi:threonine dehydrogenase-like Zn-dependent dehydrogenase
MKEGVYDRTMELTKGRGADACIDVVGAEAEPMASADSMLDWVKTATFMGTDRPHVLRQAIHCCRNFGTVSVVGVYGRFLDKEALASPDETYRFCANWEHEGCNWMVTPDDHHTLCAACRHNRTIPDISNPIYRSRWQKIEAAK